MKFCSKCNINTYTNKNHCPLCFDELEEVNKENKSPFFSSKSIKDTKQHKNHLLSKIMFFISVSATVICVFLNLIISKSVLWCVLVPVSLIYVWILVRHTILSQRNIFEKALFQLFGILSIILTSNILSGGGNWFWDYVVPSASLITSIVMIMFCLINKSRNEYIFSIFVLLVLLLILNTVLRATNVDKFHLLSDILIIFNSLSILGIWLFDFKNLKNSIQKIFHI